MANICEVIQYEGDNSTFVWKHPSEDFNSMTQLIVHESQEAIFFLNGEALDLFGPGRHTLETQNIPKIGKFLRRMTNDNTPFHCEVYFINQTVQMGLKWGTDAKVRYLEPEYGVPLELGACGEMNLQVCDSRKLVVKLVGTMYGISWHEGGTRFTKSIQSAFRPLISNAVKSNLTSAITEQKYSILEVDSHLEELSETLRKKISPGFEEYGLTVPQFYLTTVVFPEYDPNFRRIKELHTIELQKKMIQVGKEVRTAQAQAEAEVAAAERQVVVERQTTQTTIARSQAERDVIKAQAEAQATRLHGLAEAEVMQAKGYTEKDVLQADVQKAYAAGLGKIGENGAGGGGSAMSDILGLGIGLQAAGAMGRQLQNVWGDAGLVETPAPNNSPASEQTILCPNCGNKLPANAKFCLECGTKIESLAPNEMICPKCGKKTPKGKFCIECGASLSNRCPNCGAEVPLGGKFCLECGTRL